MNKPNFETQIDAITESGIRNSTPATDFNRTLQPLQELTLREISTVGGGFAPMYF